MDLVNRMDFEAFVAHFGNVVQGNPLCAASVWTLRPFTSVAEIHRHICEFLDKLPPYCKEGILRCLPDLAGRLAAMGKLSKECSREQVIAGLVDITPEERARLTEMNTKYKAKFGFPFVVCARENRKRSIMKGIEESLEKTQGQELLRGIDEVKKICWLRLLDVVENIRKAHSDYNSKL
ncbi:2-oxo-4-hydroxy-4-carboxy-5-ureidoimidazoline decarboxylase [Lingula anatina]|uniref:2-oxo-4-hydroxy-4-carboxy-5-ureidoimidazoline decarboxylase n=1 Tax=Lingula anatina TaxID=7574 RepID=A0A1S3H8A7_LINAN|nr:2-oxo-4-hydroxy-4-carboxy-5-ureidoimidazoline decarboxylase [Lingula anatina]|eukprot:XP_013382233.1 2-oxo-4-hydroxy-4-carboxy-5-ureidoimidazoline decarboxylase [Lingula anatina]